MPSDSDLPRRKRRVASARTLALAAAILLAGSAAFAAAPSAAALKKVETLPATRMGVDRAGNLWAWEKRTATIAVVTPEGGTLAAWKAPGAQAVDEDEEWGLAGLYKTGHEIRWSRRGMPDVVVPLPAPALDVCWVGPATVAVTPLANDRRVEVWNLQSAVLARSFGREPAIGRGPGAVPLRSVLLRFDPARQRLYTLESATGHLQVFDLEGRLLWGAAFANPHRAEIEAWLRDVDAERRRRVAPNGRSSSTSTPPSTARGASGRCRRSAARRRRSSWSALSRAAGAGAACRASPARAARSSSGGITSSSTRTPQARGRSATASRGSSHDPQA